MIMGISPIGHDCAVSMIDGSEIVFAAHSERYSRKKNDGFLNQDIIDEAMSYGPVNQVVYCEQPWLKKTRQLYSGQYQDMKFNIRKYLKNYNIPLENLKFMRHHKAHALSGYYTSPFAEACVVCIDAIGEWDTVTIWKASGKEIELIESIKYPHSLGLLYSAFTQLCGLKPNEDEYIMMGMAAFGSPKYKHLIIRDLLDLEKSILHLKVNVHRGLGSYLEDAKKENVAASVQELTENVIRNIMKYAKEKTGSRNLVYSGGVALNCVANSKIADLFNNIWIMPNPGDAGTCLGVSSFLAWTTPFLGHNIDRPYPIDNLLKELLKGNIVGVANGRAEFGPRALGNRSLLADPRIPNIKDRVNEIKRRQKFRPFSPAIMHEKASHYFNIPYNSVPYMQYVAECLYPQKFPAIVHVDNTSRVQTVNYFENSGFYTLLRRFYEETGCPMLLNTSLNIKGEPLVNTWREAKDFEAKYNIKVY